MMDRFRHRLWWAVILAVLLAAGIAGAMEIHGTLDVAGDLKVSGAGHAVVFGDGSRQTSAAMASQRVKIVSPVGTSTDNGSALLAALAAISDATADKPWLIKIEPGLYDLSGKSLTMIPYVDIEGSGETLTRISGQASGDGISKAAVVKGASHAELRFLSLSHTGGGNYAVGVYNNNASPDITRVNISSSGAALMNIGIYNKNTSQRLRSLNVEVSEGKEAYGIWNQDSTPFMSGGMIDAYDATLSNIGVFNDNSHPTMEYLTIETGYGERNFCVINEASDPVMHHLAIYASWGEHNLGIYNHSNASPVISMLEITATGGTETNIGINNDHALPRIIGGTISALGGKTTYGLYINESDLVVERTQVSAGDASNINNAIHGQNSSFTLYEVEAVAEGTGAYNVALDIDSSLDTVSVSHSRFRGDGYSINCDAGAILNAGLSQLAGPLNSDGTWRCNGCYDGNFTELGSDCR